ncbi:cobalt ABC transporter ATP-binding protein [Tumebacillus algifaecis]|uniref:Cobalt ABC transporter ATP-binding protein n=1 Tax=Tumebacillus algifaecis TaxID=1214604 RepID=A0A223CWK0_9BACL|nr:ABC transporter ATP-binding protein [Tumebacillus algifaecis]ASS73699.1 cobalt ABC transporter ATP-binding protein [Tumebacillus algifaecis]
MNSIFEVTSLTYSYPGASQPALNNLTLSIPQGKKTVLCGHNGSGKSTLFLQAIGINRPDAGVVSWKGEPLTYKHKALQKLRQNIGLVFQDPEQQLILNTPLEDISYGLRNAKLPEAQIEARTTSILNQLKLTELADQPLHQLSLGQKKRVALAGVLALEPELLLLDEPTAYLDRRSEQLLLEELERVHSQGVTTVMATHDMNLAYAYADWMLVLDHGRCVLAGPPAEVFQNEEQITALGLELPILYQLWQALPEARRHDIEPPRDVSSFKRLLQGQDTEKGTP